ncbi:hypothetical protein ScPMuIL_007383 [Solemya velum]
MADERKLNKLAVSSCKEFCSEQDTYSSRILQKIFSEDDLLSEASSDGAEKALTLNNVQGFIQQSLDKISSKDVSNKSGGVSGRIGRAEVQFDLQSKVGVLITMPDRLGCSSHSNFSTIRANCCVYKGKWIYELMLGSKGVMQLGWCTANCRFHNEGGVGDTPDSFAYDGSRIRKWNVKTQKYGEAWLTGDVISCAIDCDNQSIIFYRNGKCLGTAFTEIRTGAGYAYFPATDDLDLNILTYPISGYRPLQDPPQMDLGKAQMLFSFLERLTPIVMEEENSELQVAVKDSQHLPPLAPNRSQKSSLLLIAAHIFDKLSPLLRKAYIVEACLLKCFQKHCDTKNYQASQPYIIRILDFMWAFMQDFELKPCLQHLSVSVLSAYRFSPVTPDFKFTKIYLALMIAVLRHQETRFYLLNYSQSLTTLTFDEIKFPIFLHIKPPDDVGLAALIPTVWWPRYSKDDVLLPVDNEEERNKKENYYDACEKLRKTIEEIEEMQIEMLKILLIHTDLTTDGCTTRVIFMKKFRKFLKENCHTESPLSTYMATCPLPVTMCFFHRMVRALQYYWNKFQKEDPDRFVKCSEAFMPIQEFWSDSRDYFDYQRCGGLMSHLNRTFGSEVNKAQGLRVSDDGSIIKILKKGESSKKVGYPETEMPSGNSLMELLDGVVMLYYIGAHKQLAKMCSLRENMKEFTLSLQDTEEKLDKCDSMLPDVQGELERSKAVFEDKITDQARQMGWIIAVIYAKSKQIDVGWLLRVALKSVEKASLFSQLFQYVPEFYIDTVINSYNALKNFFHPTVAFESLEGQEELTSRFAMFLAKHFADSRIVNTDTRDNVVQALACFTCYPASLRALENLPFQSAMSMVKSLISPYENRSWAQTNWILVRIWKGCGFGFRYAHLPHLVPSKIQPTEFGQASLQKPCPSRVLQGMLSQILLQDGDTSATKFLDTLLSQLNWSFSEFIGMMQEIQQVVKRTNNRLLESRQIKICAACFEITVCLMRVVEMIVTRATAVFTDWSKSSAELLLGRLIQLLCQVLNRVATKDSLFDSVSSLYIMGLECVTHYPILSVTAGILIQLVLQSGSVSKEKVTKVLLSDPGFQLSSLEFMLGCSSDIATPGDDNEEKHFNFEQWEEVSKDEIKNLKALIEHLRAGQKKLPTKTEGVTDDELCTICYANPRSAVFSPCGHQSCRTCISHQLLSKKECFFCKALLTAVSDLKGNKILEASTAELTE